MAYLAQVKSRLVITHLLAAAFALFGAAGSVAASAIAPVNLARSGTQFDVAIADAKAMMLIDPSRAVAKARAAEVLADRLEGQRRLVGIATAAWLQGEANLRLNDVAKAAPLIDRAIGIVARAGRSTKLYGDLLLSRGGLHTATADVAAALDDYQRAHNIFRDIGDTRGRAISLLSIALLYQEAEDYQNALKYYDQSLEIYRGDPQILYAIYNNRANVLKELGQINAAEEQFRQALELARQQNSAAMEVRVLSNIARLQLVAKRPDLADRTIAQGLALIRGDDAVAVRNEFWALAANSALQKDQVVKAAALIDRSFVGVNLSKTTLEMREAHKIAYDIFRRTGAEQKALVHLEALKRLDDQTSKLAASANTSLAAARFDFANQELRIAKLKADDLQRNIDVERAQARTRKKIAAGIAVVVLVILGLLAFGIVTLRRSRNEVRAANVDLATTNNALGKALAAKTEFLATTSHEIRTPLNGILGMTQVMLVDRALDAQLRDRIGVVHGAGITMRALVDDILDVAKMETGNLTIEHAPFDLRATLSDVSRMWQEQAQARGLDFTLDLEQAPHWIQGDAGRLRQVAFNLLSNAMKFTASGGVSLRGVASGDRLRIVVRDTGIGIPCDKHELIFESFRQVDAGTTRKFGGTGLGLAICRNLARAMDGDVRVDSVAGEGSTFILDLPLIHADAPQAILREAIGKALLIVDRSPITRSMLRAMVEGHAGRVIFASSPEEAVELLAAGQIEHVLIDDTTINWAADRDAALSSIALAATEAGAATSLLWDVSDEKEHAILLATGVGQVIARPVTGTVLAQKLYDLETSSAEHLVSQAA